MALTAKQARCATCGSSDIIKEHGGYRCRTCGSNEGLMNQTDLARVNRICLMGGSETEVAELRSRYPKLGVVTRTDAAGVDFN